MAELHAIVKISCVFPENSQVTQSMWDVYVEPVIVLKHLIGHISDKLRPALFGSDGTRRTARQLIVTSFYGILGK